MTLKDWFAAKRKDNKHLDPEAINARLSDEALCALWTQCFNCHATLPTKDLTASQMVCSQCGYHFRIGARERIEMLTEHFDELDSGLTPSDPLNFSDTKPYVARQKEAIKKTQLNEAIVTGIGSIEGHTSAIGIMDFSFMGGAMGSVVGEKITRLTETAMAKRIPLVLFCASGGARMQEGTFSLMQMVKTSAALARFHEAGLLYVTVLSEPTFGGVTASYGMLGDVIIAEEGARIGFAGRRVIEQTIRQKLPADFQTANYLLKYGQVDMVVKRPELKPTLANLIRLHLAARPAQVGDYHPQSLGWGMQSGSAAKALAPA
jgi:acetyl-CoA carboxylase carboxyl transferase subunit beta